MSRPVLHIAIALLALASLAATALASAERARRAAPTPLVTSAPALEPLPEAPPARPSPRPAAIYGVVAVKPGHAIALRSAPGGRVLAAIGAQTGFGSPQELSVAATHGPWLAVAWSGLPNGSLAWVDGRSRSLTAHRTSVSLLVRLSQRLLELRVGMRRVAAITVGVGGAGSPTPTGRFAVTDKLSGTGYGPYYGCCVLALSGHQPAAPAGWPGGDRLAIHGTDDPATIGAAASAGCLHASDADLRVLMRRVPLGTPVFIER